MAAHLQYHFCLRVKRSSIGATYCSWPCIIIMTILSILVYLCIRQSCIGATFVVFHAVSWPVIELFYRICGHHWCLSSVVSGHCQPPVAMPLLQRVYRQFQTCIRVITVVLCCCGRFTPGRICAAKPSVLLFEISSSLGAY